MNSIQTASLLEDFAPIAKAPVIQVNRRSLLRGVLGSVALGLVPTVAFSPSINAASAPALRRIKFAPNHSSASVSDRAEWVIFRDRFISPEGRVIDTANGGVSHSEGQGYGLLLAEWANDRPTFERVLAWTQAHLSRPSDSLHAWCWDPRQNVNVRDLNTATDGELAIAWALLRASQRWNVAAWRSRAEAMSRDILAVSARSASDRLFLLPGAVGFDHVDRLYLNPSYYNFPAIRALATATNDARWAQIDEDGLWLLERARFGNHSLPADWIDVMKANAEVRPPSNRPLMFSWDAVRVPLFLAWAGENNAGALGSAAQFWGSSRNHTIPAWADLRTSQLAPYAGHAGIVAIARLSIAAVNRQNDASVLPSQASAPDYYAGALALLARIAWQESRATNANSSMS